MTDLGLAVFLLLLGVGGYKLGLKLAFLAFAFVSGVIFLVDAFSNFRRREPIAGGLSMYVGGLAVGLGVLFSLKLVSGL